MARFGDISSRALVNQPGRGAAVSKFLKLEKVFADAQRLQAFKSRESARDRFAAAKRGEASSKAALERTKLTESGADRRQGERIEAIEQQTLLKEGLGRGDIEVFPEIVETSREEALAPVQAAITAQDSLSEEEREIKAKLEGIIAEHGGRPERESKKVVRQAKQRLKQLERVSGDRFISSAGGGLERDPESSSGLSFVERQETGQLGVRSSTREAGVGSEGLPLLGTTSEGFEVEDSMLFQTRKGSIIRIPKSKADDVSVLEVEGERFLTQGGVIKRKLGSLDSMEPITMEVGDKVITLLGNKVISKKDSPQMERRKITGVVKGALLSEDFSLSEIVIAIASKSEAIGEDLFQDQEIQQLLLQFKEARTRKGRALLERVGIAVKGKGR